MNSNGNLKKGVIWSSISSFSRYVLQFGGIIILARLLSPSEYGIIGIMAVFISVADIVIDAGLCGAIIKKENVRDIDYSTLSTFNLIVSIIIYLIYYLSAPLLAEYYEQPTLTSLLRVYSLSILIFAITIAPKAKLTKSLRFKTLSLISIISGTLGLIAAIVLACNGYGPMSLVMQYLTNAIVSSILTLYFSKFHISFGFSKDSFVEQFSFGFNTTIANTLKSVSENIYNNIIGKTANLMQTGYFTQSLKLMNVPVGFFYSLIDGTYFPVLSQIHNEEEFREKMKDVNNKTLSIVLLLFSFGISLNKEIVYILLGEKWIDMSWSLFMLLISGLFITWGNIGRNIIKSTGKTFLILKYESIVFIISILCLVSIYKLGYEVIVSSYLAISIIKSIYINYLAGKIIKYNLVEQIAPLRSIAFFSILMILINTYIKVENYWLSLIIRFIVNMTLFSTYLILYKPSFFKMFKYGKK